MQEFEGCVEDIEEWRLLASESETGVYTLQAFMLYNTDTEVYVRTPKLAKKVFKRLYKRQGWDRRFADNVTPLVNYQAPRQGDAHYETFKATGRGSYKVDFSKEGGWFAAVPIDYLSQLDDGAAMCFDLEDKPRFSIWAIEATAIKSQGKAFPMLEEFNYQLEYCIHNGMLMSYDSNPDARRMRQMARRGQL